MGREVRYAIWTAGIGGTKVAEVESAEEALEYVRAHTNIIPIRYKRPRSTIQFTTDVEYVAIEVDDPGTEPA